MWYAKVKKFNIDPDSIYMTCKVIFLSIVLLLLVFPIKLGQAQRIPVSIGSVTFHYNPGPVGKYVNLLVWIYNSASTEKVVSVMVQPEGGLSVVPNEPTTVTVPPPGFLSSYGSKEVKFLVKGEYSKTYTLKIILLYEGSVVEERIEQLTLANEVRVVFELFDEFDNSPVSNAQVYVWPSGYSSYYDRKPAIRIGDNRYEIIVPKGSYGYSVYFEGAEKIKDTIVIANDIVIPLKLDAGGRGQYYLQIISYLLAVCIVIAIIIVFAMKYRKELTEKLKKRRTKVYYMALWAL